ENDESPALANFQKEKEALNQNLASLNRKLEELNRQFQGLREKNKEDLTAGAEIVRAAEKKKGELREIENMLRNLELTEEKFRIKEEDLKSKIREAQLPYEETLNFARGLERSEINEDEKLALEPIVLEEKIFKIKRELGEIGAIDEDLLREFKETGERYEFLNNQSEDLKKAIAALNDLILELEEKINKEFNGALVKINQSFDKYFQLMFGGGGAKLVKTAIRGEPEEEQNGATRPPIEEVLEIKVDLPRKKIKGLDMLSGGERAITSIALLFGIIATSPPPFLILDEIDAALDEANSLKFARLLKDLSKETQFILITHNRQTMNEANALYGVTMGQEGVSRLLSLELEEAEEIRRQYQEKA
ncbi:MAG: AAA family ATPase, partial [bacterium]|nr:AAA family ATPase [bacterium]